ncbi:MAG TPA: SpoIIE family protein phosphatase [Phycisphaerae bacterium]|nr:SpoIIE family protein phosphatase [Phycisphaerae bacterium]HNU46961.1 SpoIIE family protein phosphatase [Phycisphaerae bacterium]
MRLEITDTRTLTDQEPVVRELEFSHTAVTIGADSGNMLQLADEKIATFHGLILPLGEDRWVFRPMDPQAQTLLNGEPVQGQVELEDEMVLQIGPFTLKFSADVPVELELPEARNLEELARIRDFPLPPRSEVRRAEVEITLNPARRSALVAFDARLRATTDLAQVLECTLDLLLPELSARTVWVAVRRSLTGELEQMAARNDKGPYSGEPFLWDAFQYRCLTRHQFIAIPRTGQKDTQSMLAVPLLSSKGALGLIVADTRKHRKVFNQADLDFATAVAAFVGSQVEAILDHQATSQAQSAAGHMVLLREIQSRLDPQNVPQWTALQIAAFARPGVERAGDFCDIMRLPNGLAAVFVARVEAAPLRAAQAMAETRAAYRLACMHADPPHIQLRALNYLLYDEQDPVALHIALFLLNPKTGAVEYATAGRVGVLILDDRGRPRFLVRPDIPVVGKNKGHEYAGATDRLKPGETLALFTKGCATVRGAGGEPLGEKRFVEALCDGFGQPAAGALAELLADLEPYLRNGTPPDDITILLVHHVAAST